MSHRDTPWISLPLQPQNLDTIQACRGRNVLVTVRPNDSEPFADAERRAVDEIDGAVRERGIKIEVSRRFPNEKTLLLNVT